MSRKVTMIWLRQPAKKTTSKHYIVQMARHGGEAWLLIISRRCQMATKIHPWTKELLDKGDADGSQDIGQRKKTRKITQVQH